MESKIEEESRRKLRPSLPLIIMGNMKSLANKLDELQALIRTQTEYP